jgi:hypothetical protein
MRLGNRLRAAAQVLAIFFGGAAQANIVTNPGFETGDFTGWTLSGDTSFTFVEGFFPHSGSFSAFRNAWFDRLYHSDTRDDCGSFV